MKNQRIMKKMKKFGKNANFEKKNENFEIK